MPRHTTIVATLLVSLLVVPLSAGAAEDGDVEVIPDGSYVGSVSVSGAFDFTHSAGGGLDLTIMPSWAGPADLTVADADVTGTWSMEGPVTITGELGAVAGSVQGQQPFQASGDIRGTVPTAAQDGAFELVGTGELGAGELVLEGLGRSAPLDGTTFSVQTQLRNAVLTCTTFFGDFGFTSERSIQGGTVTESYTSFLFLERSPVQDGVAVALADLARDLDAEIARLRNSPIGSWTEGDAAIDIWAYFARAADIAAGRVLPVLCQEHLDEYMEYAAGLALAAMEALVERAEEVLATTGTIDPTSRLIRYLTSTTWAVVGGGLRSTPVGAAALARMRSFVNEVFAAAVEDPAANRDVLRWVAGQAAPLGWSPLSADGRQYDALEVHDACYGGGAAECARLFE